MILWSQIIIRLELDAVGAVHLRDAEIWRVRRVELQALGGPPMP